MDVWVYEITTRRCRLHSLFLRMHISPSIWSPLTTVRGVSIMNRSCFQWVRLWCDRKEIKMRGGRCVRKEKRPIGRLTNDRNTHTHSRCFWSGGESDRLILILGWDVTKAHLEPRPKTMKLTCKIPAPHRILHEFTPWKGIQTVLLTPLYWTPWNKDTSITRTHFALKHFTVVKVYHLLLL